MVEDMESHLTFEKKTHWRESRNVNVTESVPIPEISNATFFAMKICDTF